MQQSDKTDDAGQAQGEVVRISDEAVSSWQK
jgi:hypothetical protein